MVAYNRCPAGEPGCMDRDGKTDARCRILSPPQPARNGGNFPCPFRNPVDEAMSKGGSYTFDKRQHHRMQGPSAMWALIASYWPHILAAVTTLMAAVAAAHAAMSKDAVSAAIGRDGVILLSPFVGTLLYAVAGINRIRRTAVATERGAARHEVPEHASFDADSAAVASRFGRRFAALKRTG